MAVRTKAAKPADFKKVIIDTTVQEKAITPSVPALRKGFPGSRGGASLGVWKQKRTSCYPLLIAHGWRVGLQAGIRRRSWFGGRGSC
jgi:hypothetical protein